MSIFTGGRHAARQRFRRFIIITAAGIVNSCHQKLLGVVVLAGLATLAGGCAAVAPLSSALGVVNPTTTLQVFNTTELRLQQKNFIMVKPDVMGQSKGFSFLGLITIVPAKFTTAMNRLNAHADLKPGTSRTLANLVLEKDSTFFILFSIPRTSVRADVIEFVPDIQPQPPPAQLKVTAER